MPRKTNVLCKRPLLPGLMDGKHAIGGKDVVEVIEDVVQGFALATFPACETGKKTPVEGTGKTMAGRAKRKPAPTAFETGENGEAQ